MRAISLLMAVVVLTGFTYGYKNNPQTGKPDMVVTSVTTADVSGFVAGTDYLAPTGSAALLTGFPTLNQNTTGSAAKLTTPRTINGVSFDGTANITVSPPKITQSGTVTTGAATGPADGVYYGAATVIFPVAFPDTNYSISGSTNTIAAWMGAAGSKTTTSCGIYILGITATSVVGRAVDWIAVQR